MRFASFIILAFLNLGCSDLQTCPEQIIGEWAITEVINMDNRNSIPDNLNDGARWTFSNDSIFSFEVSNNYYDLKHKGNWYCKDKSIIIVTKNDTSELKILKLSEDNLIWDIIEDGSTLRFSLLRFDNKTEIK